MNRKLSIVVLIALVVSALLPATGLAQEATTVRYFTFSAAPDYLEELDTIIAAFEEANPGITIEVATAPYYPRALEAFQYEGMQYGLPETFSTVLLFYNMDLFDQAGVAYPTADWT